MQQPRVTQLPEAYNEYHHLSWGPSLTTWYTSLALELPWKFVNMQFLFLAGPSRLEVI